MFFGPVLQVRAVVVGNDNCLTVEIPSVGEAGTTSWVTVSRGTVQFARLAFGNDVENRRRLDKWLDANESIAAQMGIGITHGETVARWRNANGLLAAIPCDSPVTLTKLSLIHI